MLKQTEEKPNVNVIIFVSHGFPTEPSDPHPVQSDAALEAPTPYQNPLPPADPPQPRPSPRAPEHTGTLMPGTYIHLTRLVSSLAAALEGKVKHGAWSVSRRAEAHSHLRTTAEKAGAPGHDTGKRSVAQKR